MSIKYLSPLGRPATQSLVDQVYRQIAQEFGLIADPFRLHAPVPELLAGIWSVTREIGVARHVPWPMKEAVAAAVSQSNACPYCVEIHAAVASVRTEQPLAPLLTQGRTADITDPSLRAVVTWALATRSPGSAPLLHPPFTEEQAPEIIGVAMVYHYLNRLVQVFLPDSLLPSVVRGGWSGSVAWRLVGRKLAGSRERERVAGASLPLVPAADLPSACAWAAPEPSISRALAGWAAVVEHAGMELLAQKVRTLVSDFLQGWQGEQMPLSRAWVNQVVAPLPEADQAAGRLALLAAVAPHQIDAAIIRAFRVQQEADTPLVGVVAWASFQAARRIVSWLRVPTQREVSSQLGHTLDQSDDAC
ncbi:MAG: carboxymuconolactone decarboxylase family protein [Ktedonobacteraceae bacterium]|nr:carboxymuconolactone decarboxylase family protein [Ktedonobacteraceae bacterium]